MAVGRRDRRSHCTRRDRSVRNARRAAATVEREGHSCALSSESLGGASSDGALHRGCREKSFEDVMQLEPPGHQGTKRIEPISTQLDDVARAVVDAAFKVHTELGPGLLESVYEICLAHELRKRRLQVDLQVA